MSVILHSFGMWKETSVPREDPRRKYVQTTQTVALAKITIFSLVLQQNDIQGPAVSEK